MSGPPFGRPVRCGLATGTPTGYHPSDTLWSAAKGFVTHPVRSRTSQLRLVSDCYPIVMLNFRSEVMRW